MSSPSPMQASVTLVCPEGVEHVLGHGDLIGRVWSAALCLDDARVSEAHAMVSLRGATLQLLALRGLFALDGQVHKSIELAVGQRIALAQGVELDVRAVHLPSRVLALGGADMSPLALSGTCSLFLRPQPRLRPGAREGAVAVFYLGPSGWKVRTEQGAVDLVAGWEHPSGVRVDWLTLQGPGAATRILGGVNAPIRLVTRFDSVTLFREGHPELRLTGMTARLVSELAAVGAPLHWEALAREIWGDNADTHFLRKRFDALLGRLRRKLREAGVPATLVRSDRSGLFELVLRPEDTLVDES